MTLIRNIGRTCLAVLLIVATTGVPTIIHKCSVMGDMAPFETCGTDHSDMDHPSVGLECVHDMNQSEHSKSVSISALNCCSQVDATVSIRGTFTAPAHHDITVDVIALHSMATPPAVTSCVKWHPLNTDSSPPGSPSAYILHSVLLI